jgi:hypothetical protein
MIKQARALPRAISQQQREQTTAYRVSTHTLLLLLLVERRELFAVLHPLLPLFQSIPQPRQATVFAYCLAGIFLPVRRLCVSQRVTCSASSSSAAVPVPPPPSIAAGITSAAAAQAALTPGTPTTSHLPKRICFMVEPSPFTYVCGYMNRYRNTIRFLTEAGCEVLVITPGEMTCLCARFCGVCGGVQQHHVVDVRIWRDCVRAPARLRGCFYRSDCL